MTWTSILARLIACPIVVAISDYLFAGIHFAAPVQWIAVGVVMALISIALDTIFLDRLGWLGAALLNTVLVAETLRSAPSLMPKVVTTRPASIGVGVLFGLLELVMHVWLFGAPMRGRRVRSIE